ncbi:MAG: alkaline phosphatase family protein [Vulcanimicrobiaceae bacterium]
MRSTSLGTRALALVTTLSCVGSIVAPASAAPFRHRHLIGGSASSALLPTGLYTTATATPGSTLEPLGTGLRPDGNADAAEAVTTAMSPDGKTMLVLTSGYNLNFNKQAPGAPVRILHDVLDPITGAPAGTTPKGEWVFVYDVAGRTPVVRQRINLPNTYNGLVWAPDGKSFYVSGGIDDRIYIYKATAPGSADAYEPSAPFVVLGHNSNGTAPVPAYDGGLLKPYASTGVSTGAVVAGLSVSADGNLLTAANFENDSLSLVDTKTHKVRGEISLATLGNTTPRGEFPYWTAVRSNSGGAPSKVYVSSMRDDEIVAIDTVGRVKEIRTGKAPNRILLSHDQSRLYVANGDADTISVVDTARDAVVATIPVFREGDRFRGASPNSLALSPNGRMLYVTLGNENAVAVIDLAEGRVIGRIPTGWFPNSVSVSADGSKLYVVNAKSPSGPAPANRLTTDAGNATNVTNRNQYNWALEKAGLLTIPLPDRNQLARLSAVVDNNNGFNARFKDPMMTFLNKKIKHVIYIVNENRTFDQALGDLPGTDADPSLNLFPFALSPNHHRLQSEFATFDQFYVNGESSGVGWNWALQAHTNDFVEKTQSVLYGNAGFQGLTYDYQSSVRKQNLALPIFGSTTTGIPGFPQFSARSATLAGAPGILPGSEDPAASIGDGDLRADAIGGFIWDTVLRTGKTVRDYGVNTDQTYYNVPKTSPLYLRPSAHAFEEKLPQSPNQKLALVGRNDDYFRSFDMEVPDQYRLNEWEREFNLFVERKNLPNFEIMSLPHDHFGSFATALDGLTTPELQYADNDYALGRLVEDVSKSPYWESTAIVLLEDDSQNGGDHLDGHRSFVYVISPYTKRGLIDHTTYNQVNALRTIEDILGAEPLSDFDANAVPMSTAFTTKPDTTEYDATIPGVLCAAPVATTLVPACRQNTLKRRKTAPVRQLHGKAWWSAMTEGMDFTAPDRLDAKAFNRVLWRGIKGDRVPYPGSELAKSDD